MLKYSMSKTEYDWTLGLWHLAPVSQVVNARKSSWRQLTVQLQRIHKWWESETDIAEMDKVLVVRIEGQISLNVPFVQSLIKSKP